MLKVLLIDDEYMVRKGLKETIDWNSLGLEVAGEADGYRQALEQFKKLLPEIVITDIRLKSKNGLDIISKIKQINPNTEIIIISGYDSFEYAHSALKQNVEFYLLKPVNNDELIEALNSCKSNIENRSQITAAVENYVKYQRNNFLLDILNDNDLSENSLKYYCNIYNINLPGNLYMIAIIKLNANQSDNQNPHHKLMMQLKNEISYSLSLTNIYAITAEQYDSMILMLFCRDDTVSSKIDNFLKMIQASFYDNTDISVSIGISGIFRNPLIVTRAYAQALKALEMKSTNDSNNIMDYVLLNSKPSIEKFDIDDTFIEQMIDALHRLDKESLQTMINNCFDNIVISNSEELQEFKSSILNLIIAIINDAVIDSNYMIIVFGKTINPAFDIQNAGTVSQLKANLIFIVNKLIHNDEFRLLSVCKPLVRNAVLYIMKNYAKQISIKDVADNLFISPYHLMREFKKTAGKTFNAFLTEYRIKTSVLLIQSGKYKIYEVSSLVGYNDVDYFYRIFKKFTSHPPTYYSTPNPDKIDFNGINSDE